VLGAGTAQLSAPRRISSDEFGWIITFSFPAGQRGYAWNWTACTKTSEATDGIGLPGPNGCGSERIHASAPGMLASPCARYLACAAPAPGVKPAPPPAPGQTPPTSPPPTSAPSTSPTAAGPTPAGPTPTGAPPTTPPPGTVTVHSPGDQAGTEGAAVSLPVSATDSAGGALSYTDNGTLPPGLVIGSASGLITGTLTTAGSYPVTITATDASGHSGQATFTWSISHPTPTVTLPSPGDQAGAVSGAVSLGVTGTDSAGEALSYTDSGTLPPGLVIDPASGLITGTLTTAGSYPVTITATDTSGVTGSVSFTWTVS
jgi:hypothetical protein